MITRLIYFPKLFNSKNMKRLNNIIYHGVRAAFAALILTTVFGAAVRAQTPPPTVTPQVTCVTPHPTDPAFYIAYFGYTNRQSEPVYIPDGTSSNFFFPFADPPNAPSYFLPGVHRKVVAVNVRRTVNESWVLNDVVATASFNPGLFCGGNITYQGRLSNAAAAANGSYDLRFQVFDALTGGTAQSDPQTITATVTNGVFTVLLDADALGIPREQTGQLSTYLEISVRQGTAAFTTLAPRQPITATPFAINAITANSATNAANATNATNATNVSGGFVQLPLTTGAPPSSECSATSQYGRQKVDATNVRLYICTAAGWKFTALQ